MGAQGKALCAEMFCRDTTLPGASMSKQLFLHLWCMIPPLFPASVAGVISLMCNIVSVSKCIVSEGPLL